MSGCWLWDGSYSGGGYGTFYVGGRLKQMPAHRFSYEVHKGPIPEGLFVCHHCDVRECVNPDHLFVGTQSDNIQDMLIKKRGNPRRGEACANARFTEQD